MLRERVFGLYFTTHSITVTLAYLLFISAIDARVGIPIGQTSAHDKEAEQVLPKCSLYIFFISFLREALREVTR